MKLQCRPHSVNLAENMALFMACSLRTKSTPSHVVAPSVILPLLSLSPSLPLSLPFSLPLSLPFSLSLPLSHLPSALPPSFPPAPSLLPPPPLFPSLPLSLSLFLPPSLSPSLSPFLSPSLSLSLPASLPQKYSTLAQVIPKTRFPRWKKTFELKMPQPSHEAGAPPPSIKIIVYNFDTFSQNQFMGEVRTVQQSFSAIARLS